MKTKLLIAAITAAFSMSAFAQTTTTTTTTPAKPVAPAVRPMSPAPAPMAMTDADYKAQKKQIDDTYKAAKDRCKSLSANAKDICKAEVDGEKNIAEADLKAKHKPTEKNVADAKIAKANAQYKVDKEKCDDMKGNDKDVCVKEAKAKETKGKADAKVALAKDKVMTGATPAEKAPEKVADAKRNAIDDKKDADYKVAKEKCDALSGQPKDNCVAQAKLKFGK